MKKRLIVSLLVFAACLTFTPTQVFAWGPERTTYTNESPAPRAVFNSITNNAGVGDEREFVRMREKNSGKTFTADVDRSGFLVEPGKTYEVYIYYHNDAASETNYTGAGVATGVKLATHFTSKVSPNENGYVNATITSQTNVPKVWDDIKLISKEEVTLRYVNHSAVIHNDWGANGTLLTADYLFSEDGTYLGVDDLNGVVFGCAEYSGYITYELQTDEKTIEPVPYPEPEPVETCATNPNLPGCQEMPDTGPAEIMMAIVIVLGIGGAAFYLIYSRRTLRKVEAIVTGKDDKEKKEDDPSSQNEDNMVK